jgi:integrase/recombinase XerD
MSISSLAEQFLSYKKSMGYKYKTAELYLNTFIKYVKENEIYINVPNKETVNSWLNKSIEHPGSLYNKISIIREFGKYLVANGYEDVYVIPQKHGNRLEAHLPYFFTANEINHFFKICIHMKKHKDHVGRDLVIPELFKVLYCCGLRCMEVRMLKCCNVCLSERYLDILQSKGPKNRRIFISSELSEELIAYDIKIRFFFPDRVYFFPNRYDQPYDGSTIAVNFNKIWYESFPGFNATPKPRAYDFRHHFAWANLNRWVQEGTDVNVMIPYLMRYMGHSHIKSTLYYFHFVPEFFGTFATKTKSLEGLLPEVPYEE